MQNLFDTHYYAAFCSFMYRGLLSGFEDSRDSHNSHDGQDSQDSRDSRENRDSCDIRNNHKNHKNRDSPGRCQNLGQ